VDDLLAEVAVGGSAEDFQLRWHVVRGLAEGRRRAFNVVLLEQRLFRSLLERCNWAEIRIDTFFNAAQFYLFLVRFHAFRGRTCL
jgi:hypothetical protein